MKNKLPYFIVITAALLICYLYFPPNDPPFDDPQLFKYFGMAIQKGKIPYRDFFDHKPPLIYFFNYVGVLLGNYGIYLLNTLFVLLAALKFLQLNIQFRIPFPFVLPVLFCLLLKHPNYSFGGNFTREYSTLLILIAFCCLLGKSRYKMLWTGLTASLVFFFQQEQLLILVPFIGAALYEVFIEQKWRGVYRSAASLTAGFLIPCVLIFGYFLLNNSLTPFLDSAFAFNFRWYTVQAEKPGFITEMFALKKLFYQFNLDTALLVTVGIILIGFLFANSRKIWLIGAVIALPLSLISEWMSAKIAIGDAMCYYYLVPLAGTIPIALFLVLAFSKNELIKNKVFIAFCYVLLTFNLLLAFMEYAGNRFRYNYHYKESAPETLFLNKVALKDNDLYIWRSSEYIFLYNKYKILAPDKWVYHSFWEWYKDWDADNKEINGIIQNINSKKTRYIIYDRHAAEFKNLQHRLIWENNLAANFDSIPNSFLWQRKPVIAIVPPDKGGQ